MLHSDINRFIVTNKTVDHWPIQKTDLLIRQKEQHTDMSLDTLATLITP